jgi:hypothetical protein
VWVIHIHELLNSIIFNYEFQFISIVWKSLCKRLNINVNLFTDYYSQMNDQIKKVNQNVKWYLWSYCLYMQNDWFIWLFLIEFVNNNVISLSIEQFIFFLNKSFHSRMSFNLNSIEYEITRVRIEADKVKNIFKHMKQSLTVTKQALKRIRITMKKQINKH